MNEDNLILDVAKTKKQEARRTNEEKKLGEWRGRQSMRVSNCWCLLFMEINPQWIPSHNTRSLNGINQLLEQ